MRLGIERICEGDEAGGLSGAPVREKSTHTVKVLAGELGGLVTRVQGTGLLFSCELAPQFKCCGAGSTASTTAPGASTAASAGGAGPPPAVSCRRSRRGW